MKKELYMLVVSDGRHGTGYVAFPVSEDSTKFFDAISASDTDDEALDWYNILNEMECGGSIDDFDADSDETVKKAVGLNIDWGFAKEMECTCSMPGLRTDWKFKGYDIIETYELEQY